MAFPRGGMAGFLADALGNVLGNALGLGAPAAVSGDALAAVVSAVEKVCEVQDNFAVRLAQLEQREREAGDRSRMAMRIAREVAQWVGDANAAHPCSGPGCWWCEHRVRLAEAMAAAVREEAGPQPQPNQRTGSRRRGKGKQNQ